ncbi:MAG: glycosyltransferase family 2 protein [Candidatus Aquirickettsiella sp.]
MYKIKNDFPIFSIIVPTYNRPQMIKRTIKSICNQTFTDFEIIIVNDGSSHNYENSFGEFKNINLKIITNLSNQGVAQARNIGLIAAQGKYISFIDDDDEFVETFLESTYQKLHSTSDQIGFSWTGVKYLNYCDSLDKNFEIKTREFSDSYPTKQELFEQLFSIGIGFGFTFKSKCIKHSELFNNNLKVVEDTDIFFRLIIAGFLPAIIPNPQVILHNHHQQRLTNVTMHRVRIKECKWLLLEYRQFLDKYPTLRSQLLWQINHLKCELEVENKTVFQ